MVLEADTGSTNGQRIVHVISLDKKDVLKMVHFCLTIMIGTRPRYRRPGFRYLSFQNPRGDQTV